VDTNTLVSDLIDEGKRIVEQLVQNGFDVTAALWLKKAENDQWYFYIVSPLAEPERLNLVYGRLHGLIRQMPEPHWIRPLEVRLLHPSHAIAKDVLAIYQSAPGPKTSPIRWSGNMLGNLSVDGAYLYPLAAMAAE
jgi:hypothetical protein